MDIQLEKIKVLKDFKDDADLLGLIYVDKLAAGEEEEMKKLTELNVSSRPIFLVSTVGPDKGTTQNLFFLGSDKLLKTPTFYEMAVYFFDYVASIKHLKLSS